MTNRHATRIIAVGTVVVACVVWPGSARAQLPSRSAERARVIAEVRQNFASQLTVFDRQGRVAATIGSRDYASSRCFHPTRRASR